jgi:hypothetical protein
MKIKLHHLSPRSKDVPGIEAFCRSILDLEPEPLLHSTRDTTRGVRRSPPWSDEAGLWSWSRSPAPYVL